MNPLKHALLSDTAAFIFPEFHISCAVKVAGPDWSTTTEIVTVTKGLRFLFIAPSQSPYVILCDTRWAIYRLTEPRQQTLPLQSPTRFSGDSRITSEKFNVSGFLAT